MSAGEEGLVILGAGKALDALLVECTTRDEVGTLARLLRQAQTTRHGSHAAGMTAWSRLYDRMLDKCSAKLSGM